MGVCSLAHPPSHHRVKSACVLLMWVCAVEHIACKTNKASWYANTRRPWIYLVSQGRGRQGHYPSQAGRYWAVSDGMRLWWLVPCSIYIWGLRIVTQRRSLFLRLSSAKDRQASPALSGFSWRPPASAQVCPLSRCMDAWSHTSNWPCPGNLIIQQSWMFVCACRHRCAHSGANSQPCTKRVPPLWLGGLFFLMLCSRTAGCVFTECVFY